MEAEKARFCTRSWGLRERWSTFRRLLTAAQGFQSFGGSESAQQLCSYNVEFMECGDTQPRGAGGVRTITQACRRLLNRD